MLSLHDTLTKKRDKMLPRKVILKEGTHIYLSTTGYYRCQYVDVNTSFTLEEDTEVAILNGWVSGKPEEEKWKSYIMPYQLLENYPWRASNVIWVKGKL